MTANSSVEAAEAGKTERTRNDFCYFLDKKSSDYGKLEFVSHHIPQNLFSYSTKVERLSKKKIMVYAQIMPKRLATEMVVSTLL